MIGIRIIKKRHSTFIQSYYFMNTVKVDKHPQFCTQKKNLFTFL